MAAASEQRHWLRPKLGSLKPGTATFGYKKLFAVGTLWIAERVEISGLGNGRGKQRTWFGQQEGGTFANSDQSERESDTAAR